MSQQCRLETARRGQPCTSKVVLRDVQSEKGTNLTVPTCLHCVVEGPPHIPLFFLPGPDPTAPTAQPLSLPTWLLSCAVYLPKHKA